MCEKLYLWLQITLMQLEPQSQKLVSWIAAANLKPLTSRSKLKPLYILVPNIVKDYSKSPLIPGDLCLEQPDEWTMSSRLHAQMNQCLLWM